MVKLVSFDFGGCGRRDLNEKPIKIIIIRIFCFDNYPNHIQFIITFNVILPLRGPELHVEKGKKKKKKAILFPETPQVPTYLTI